MQEPLTFKDKNQTILYKQKGILIIHKYILEKAKFCTLKANNEKVKVITVHASRQGGQVL